MHNIQKIILKRLLDKNGQKYSDLTRGYSYEENIVFHLKRLVDEGFIKKENGFYLITAEGVKKITQYDLSELEDTGFKTLFIGFLCRHKDKYLIKSHPQGQTNFYNLPSGKPHFGEAIEFSLARTFEENTGLKLPPSELSFLSLHLKTVKTPGEEIIFDDAFAIYKVELNSQQFENVKLGKNIQWMDANEISELSNRWPEIDICILKEDYTKYLVYVFVTDYVL